VGIGVKADHDLALVGDVGGDPGDKLKIIHPLLMGEDFLDNKKKRRIIKI